MTPRIRRVCVFGAGTMGGGIAAHLANLGFEVVLVDQTEESCRSAFERTRQARPPHFLLPSTAETIRLTGLDEGLDAARTADWVLEAIIEKPEAKRQLYVRLEPVLRAEAFISTNTSGLEIGMLKEGFSDSFRRRFLGTHFFNPPRHLKLLELIPTEETAPEVVASMTRLLEDQVARRVVPAKDTPGFIANRFGMWSMFRATHVAERLDMTIEEVDAITGPFLGRPKTGSFRLNDVVGLDIMADIAANLLVRCQADSHTGTLRNPRSLQTLLDRGWIGNKAGQGYTRKEGREFLSLDLKTCSYRNRIEPELPLLAEIGRLPLAERIGRALDSPDRVGDFLREYLVPTLRYAEAVREEISHNVLDFDRVMQWGFGWQMGPFALIDALGPERLDLPPRQNFGAGTLFLHTGQEVPLPAEPEYRTHADFPIVDEGDGLRFRDLGDGVTWLAVTRKMGTWSPESVSALASRLESAPPARLVLGGEDRVFSAGFDLRFFLEAIVAKDWAAIDSAILAF
ncbi:MAG: 3-hydroxyacyl-CoA dehydrogenase NAD-binding domain-containing protein [Fimbriimonadaceae bacterium]|nr:3-hydroxyacyl-CoA dehydrogenase NAD-binding domain-containing protein [Fimbriimonadaceae bacterium]